MDFVISALLNGLVLQKEVFKGQLINLPQSEAQLKNKRLDMNPQQYEWLVWTSWESPSIQKGSIYVFKTDFE